MILSRIVPVLAIATLAWGEDTKKEWSRQFQVQGNPELRLDVDDGSIQIRTGSSSQIQAMVRTKGWDIGPGGIRITERQDGNRVTIDVRRPKTDGWFDMGDRSVQVELTVPAGLTAELRTGDGSIQMDGLKGSIRAKTGDGRIVGTGMDGTCNASTGDGSIRVRGRFDVLNLRTGDGTVEAEVMAGSNMAAPWEIRTGDGQITVRIPDGFNANLDADTHDGDVKVDVPVLSNASNTKEGVRGKINAGGPLLSIRTGDGAIRIERN